MEGPDDASRFENDEGRRVQLLLPLRIDFGENRFARMRVLIKGPVNEFDLPIMPFRPEGIIFNDLESVLCEVEYD